MSYDIDLRGPACEHCGRYDSGPSLPNPTYNLTPIFDLAITGEPLPNSDVSEGEVVIFKANTYRPRGLRILSGRKAEDTILIIDHAIARMQDPVWRSRFVALEPPNGWGTLAGAVDVMHDLSKAAKAYPAHIWEIQ